MVGVYVLQSSDVTTIADSINNVWILTVTFLIFFMQPGFALLESGQVRAKNAANVVMKNIWDWSAGVLYTSCWGSGLCHSGSGRLSGNRVRLRGRFLVYK